MAITNNFDNVMIDKTGGGTGSDNPYSSTAPATANYKNKNGVVVPHTWEPINTGLSQIFTKKTYAGYKDSAKDPIAGYEVPSNASYMCDETYAASDNMYDKTTGSKLKAIQRGHVPLFKSTDYKNNDYAVADKNEAYLWSNPETETTPDMPRYTPFWYSIGEGTYSMTRTDDLLKIGATELTPDKFRGGVIPRYIYAVCIGAGGGGGGVRGDLLSGGSAGGGGAGGVAGAVIDLKKATDLGATISLSTGAGGAGGIKDTDLEKTAGGKGGNAEIIIDVPNSYEAGLVRAGGGSGGKGDHGAGAGGTAYFQNLSLKENDVVEDLFIIENSINGGSGSIGETLLFIDGHEPMSGEKTSGTLSVLSTAQWNSGNTVYHFSIQPKSHAGGTDCDANTDSISGGGGGSFLGSGGNGGLDAGDPNGAKGSFCAGGGGGHFRWMSGEGNGGAGGSAAILLYY